MTKRIQRIAAHAAVLSCVCCAAYFTAYLLRFAGAIEPGAWKVFQRTLPLMIFVRLGVMLWLGRQHAWNRYFSFHDLLSLVKIVTFGSIGVTIVDAMLLPQTTIPRSIVLLDWGTTLLTLGAISSLPRLMHDARWSPFSRKDRIPALIVGANDAGEGLLRAIQRSPSLHYLPIGFVDDQARSAGLRIGGIPVLGRLADLPGLVTRFDVEEVLITSGALPGKQVRRLVNLSEERGFRVRVLPSYEQLIREDVAVKPRDVAIADLLRRPPVKLKTKKIRGWLRNRVVMVTGSAGSIGSEIARQVLAQSPGRLVLVDRSETGQFFLERELAGVSPEVPRDVVMADLTDRDRLEAIFEQVRPDIIFHAGAYKHVPLMEAHPGEAVKNIVLATRNVCDLADIHHAESLVMISTDKAVNPTSAMGSCKRVAEQYVQSKATVSNCRMVTVRFGNVLDSAGSVVPIFRQQIARGGPVTVTHESMVRYFMLIPEAAQLVVQAGAMGNGGEIFVLDMGDPVRLMDLARDMIKLSGLREGEDIEIEITGLRPGEKLYEELYGENERHLATDHSKIMVAASQPRRLLEVTADVNALVDAANEPAEIVRGLLQEIVRPIDSAGAPPQASRAAA